MLAMKFSGQVRLASRLTLCGMGLTVFVVIFRTGETGLQADPLWDGTDCLCCNNPPWFYKQLPQPTTDNIEMRVYKNGNGENIAITEIEIYAK